ncbi:hypothetical protein Pcinc_022164 [Petrolisthes cinctipes]|uniref:Uncharacterized protein n=1 Tax=Petrolisthes cinctipes TaxID=88211 RepID=A0AAE1KGD3_PETCI|nr:hypothetical protein Pcinc_022164 [Petrolisthes cinctipes]
MWWHVLLVVAVVVVAQENNPCCQLLNNGRFDEFQACTLISGTEPTCRPTCQYKGREYRVMETVVALPFQCIRLECDMKEEVTANGNYNTTSLRLVTVDDNPGCCMRGGRMVPNGYKEEDPSLPCGELLCHMGAWISGGTQPYCGKPLKECKVGLQSYTHGEIVNVEVMNTVDSTGSCTRHRCHHGEVLLDNCCCVGDGSVVACEDEKVTDSCSEHICEAGSLTTIQHKGCCLINGKRYREGEVVYAANNSNPCSEWDCQHGSLLHRTLDSCCRGPGGKMVPQGHPILIDPAKCLLVVCSEEGEAMDRSIPRKCGCCEAGLELYTNGSEQPLNQCLNTTCINSNWTLNLKPDCMECNLATPGAGTLHVKVFNNTWSAIERNCLRYTILQQPLLLHQEQEDGDDDSSLFPQQEEFSTGGQKGGRGTPTIYASLGACEPDLVFANPYAFQHATQHIRKQRIKRHPYINNNNNNNIYAHHHKVKRHHHYTINTNYHHITTTNDHYYHVKNHPYIASNNNNNHHHIKRHNNYKKNHHIKRRNNNNHIKRQSNNTTNNNSQVEKDTLDQESDNNYYNYQDLQLTKDYFKLQHTLSGEDEGWCCKSVTIHDTKVNVTVLVTGILLINGVETRPPWYNDEGDWVVDLYPHTMSIKVANTVMWLMEEQGLKITGVVTPRVTDLRGLCVTGQVRYSNTVVWSEGEIPTDNTISTIPSNTTIPTIPANITTTTNTSCPTHLLERYTFICTLLSSEKVTSVKCESVAESEEVACVQELCDCQQDQALVCLYWITLRHIRRCVALTSPSLNNTSNNSDDKDGVGKKAVDLAVSLLPFIAEYMEDLVIAMVPLNEGFRSAINTFIQFFAPDIIKFLKTLMLVANKLIPDLSPLLLNLESVLYFPKMSLLNNFEGAFRQLVLSMKEPTIQYLEQMVPVCGNFTRQVSNVTSAMTYILGPAVIPELNQLIQTDLRLLQFLTGHMQKILADIDSTRILEELTTKVKLMMTDIAPFKLEEIYKFMQLLEKSLDAMSEVIKDILDSGFSKEDLLCVFDKFGLFGLLCQGWNNPYCTPFLQ